jgi:hypothetical protein
MEKSSSPLDTLRQLRELLDAGTITPQEFETLKSRLLTPPTALPDSAAAARPADGSNFVRLESEPSAANSATAGPEYTAFPLPASPTESVDELEEEAEEPARSPLGKILAIGGGLLAVLLILYLVLGQSRSSEHLTSISQTPADTVATAPETGPQAEQLDLPPVAAPETVRVAPVVPLTSDSAATQPNAASEQTTDEQTVLTPVASEKAEEDVRNKVRDILAAYYTDMQSAPFSAEQYFAPQVELFIILRNTTPAAINAWLDQNRFLEFKDAQTQVEPGTLRISPVATDGSRVATYTERSRAFRQSLQKNQYTRAQMRVRVNSDYKITYQKQERLLENTLSDVEAPAPQ